MPKETDTDRPEIFYGWFVVIACFFVTMSLGETMWSFGVFFKPLESEFHWSRTLVSSGYTAFLIAYSFSSIVAGKISDRYGPRLILIASGALAGLGISLCSQIQSVNELRAFLAVAGLGSGATWSVPTSTVQRWFCGRQGAGLALAVVVAGVGIGALVFAPLINYFILYYGWRNAFLITGILFFVIIAAAAPLVRPNPTDVPVSPDQEKSVPLLGDLSGLIPAKVVTHPSFLILTFAACVTVLTFQVVSVHLIPYVTDLGITPTAAATAVGLMGAFSIPGRLLAGPLSERIGWKRTILISLFGMTAATVWLLFSEIEWMLYSYAFVFGLFWGIRSTVLIGALGAFFGMRLLGELIGIMTATANILAAFVPYIGGYVFDTVGSYSLVFISLATLLFGVSLLATTLKKPDFL
jgi:MFS transporter, OFA family, oxalate/formate antiporter